MRSKVFFLILVVAASGILLVAADFGESSASLGQITDEFDTLDNVSVRALTERNATLNAMELSIVPPPDFVNISAFTETDPANRYSQTDEVSTWAGIRRGDADSRLVGDMGANYFDNSFSMYFELNITDAEAGDASWRTYCLALGIQNHASNYDSDRRIQVWINQRQADPANDAVYEIYVFLRTTGGAADSDTSIAMAVGTNYFMNLTRHNTGDDVRLTIRTGSHTGPIHDTLDTSVGTFGGEFLRYIFTPAMKSNANDPNDENSGTVSRISNETGGGYFTAGYFTTEDHLSGINGSVLVQLTNATIPAGTGITAEFSSDNSSWVNPTTLTAGFMSIDLRDQNWSSAHYVRYNMTGTGADTPRLYQSRLITTQGPAGPTPGAVAVTIVESDAPWIAIAIILMCVAYLLFRSR